jgi:PAS domain S-box-containing protein
LQLSHINIADAEKIINFFIEHSDDKAAIEHFLAKANTTNYSGAITVINNAAQQPFAYHIEVFERNSNGKAIIFQTVLQPHITATAQQEYERTLEELEKKELLLNEVCRLTKMGGWEVNLTTMECIWSKEVYNIHEVDENFMPNVASGINFYHPTYMPIITQKFAELINDAIPYDLELKFITAKKRVIWVRTIGVPIVDEHKKVIGVRGVFQDIDKDRKTQDYLNNYFQYAADALVVCNKNGYIKEASPSFEKMIGYTKQELSRTTLYDLLHIEDVKAIKQHIAKAYHLPTTEIIARFKTKQQQYVWLAWNIIQQEGGFLSIVRNISIQKKREEEIEQLNKHLAEINAQKDKLFTLISHDLRSPISQVKMFIELMVKNKQRYGINNEQFNLLSIIQSNIESTFNLLTDLLAWSSAQIKKTKLQKTILIVTDVVSNCIDSVQIAAGNKQIQLQVNASTVQIDADEQMAKTIFRNILSNAVKFSFVGGTIHVHITAENNMAIITVTDNGIGIAADNIEKILDPAINFSTIGTNNERGTGLGLNLCKEFVELHDGNLYIDSWPDKGTTVQVHLPLSVLQMPTLTTVNG